MNSLYKNDNIFPEFIKIDLCDILVDKINNIIDKYKSNVKDAVIYSLIENKTIKSDRRQSQKSSFQSDELKQLLNSHLCPLIYNILKQKLNCEYNVSIGLQNFDYIKYDNGGYFEKHKDFVRINNSMSQQYTMLIGLTKKTHYSGCTILWFPLDDTNQEDYNTIITALETSNCDNCKDIFIKYNLPNNYNSLKELFNKDTDIKYMPFRINSYTSGKSLLFKSDIVHSGEEFSQWFDAKELCMITINITGIKDEKMCVKNFQEIDSVSSIQSIINDWINHKSNFIMFNDLDINMCKLVEQYKLIPFQIITSQGEYNRKTFSDTYIKYLNCQDNFEQDINTCILERINTTLVEIYEKTKKKLNTRGRESHIESKILEQSSDLSCIEKLNNIRFCTNHIDFIYKDEIMIDINNYINNNVVVNNGIVTHTEKINNTWEESSCNDDGDEYDEIAYLNCKIDIKFCFMKGFEMNCLF